MRHLLFVTGLSFIVLALNAQTKQDSSTNANNYFSSVKWRNIGPLRGGRSVCATGVLGNPLVYYMGTTGGGVWKTDDMGITWKNISDGFFKTGSVGAIAVAESDANIVYVGMGEHAPRGVMTSYGDGVYKSTDAGKTFKKMGLDATQHIARIAVHPTNANIVYLAAQGALYSKTKERGIYKSIDGGVTFKNVLYVNENTGCAEISMDMNNPLILYAAMWEHGRKPWQVISGGAGSGLYKSTDGGEHWEKLKIGLPEGMGKMSIAVCRSNAEKVFALIESDFDKEAGGLYVSNDAGASWSQVTNDHHLIQRAWYYIELFVDPNNENNLYVLSAPALKSIDGGKTWEDISATHGDYHNLWINPNNSNNMIISDDGGSAITFNGGKTWSSQNNQPTAQFYRINVDNNFPYNIYGGQQDNSSVKIASRELGSGGIGNNSFTYSAGGESAFLAFNPDDPQYVLGGSYQGTIEVLNSKASAATNIMAAPIQYLTRDAKDMKYRYDWNAPIIWSKHEPNVFYHGAQYLLRTTDTGRTWAEVSPDLTRNAKEKQGKPGIPFTNEAVGAENYNVLTYVLESPKEKGVIFTGSSCGLVYVTRDNCKTWQNITPVGLQECLINAIEVSPFDNATIYIATTRYKFNDYTPAIYKSTNYGKTWVNISNGINDGAFTRVVREDVNKKDVLYAGTETGIYISWNGGKNWEPFQLNMPVCPITDLKMHQGNLIASTSGRSFWVLDDLNLISQYKKDTSFSLYNPSPAFIVNGSSELDKSNTDDFNGTAVGRGINPSTGIVFYYQLPTVKADDKLTLEIRDANNNLVHVFFEKADSSYRKWDGGPSAEHTLSKRKGLNRFVWNMRHHTMPGVPDVYIESSYRGHKAIPGNYIVSLLLNNKKISTTATILANPLYNTTAETYATYNTVMKAMESELTTMHKMVNNINAKREQLSAIIKLLTDEKFTSLKNEANELIKKMKAWDEDMIQRKTKVYDDADNFPAKFTANYLFLINQTESDIPRINQPNIERRNELNTQWDTLKKTGIQILEKDLLELNKKMWSAGVGAVWAQ
jgi:photosystem II stability/assembly factor-like uncharacterized protein